MQVGHVQAIMLYMSISQEVCSSQACHYIRTSLVTYIKNRFPHLVLFGEVGVQQMWKPSMLTRSFGPWILDVESCLSLSCHIQLQTASTDLSTDFSKMCDARAYALAYTRGKFIYDARAYAQAS